MREYEVTINGIPHTVQLDDEAAKVYGDKAKPVGEKAAPQPKNKARTAKNKSA